MAYAEGALSGSGPFYVTVNHWLVSQNQGANLSTFYYEVGVRSDGGWATWSGATQYWGFMRSDGWNPTGTWTIDFRSRNSYIIGNGYYDMGHDGDGYRPGFWGRGDATTNHTSVGNGSTAVAWVDAPRIPKPAAAPTPVGLTEVTDDSMKYQFSGNDLRGGALVRWEFQYGKSSSFSGATTVGSSGTSTVTGLDPGTVYYFRSRAVTRGIDGSEIGGSWSSTISAETLSGVYVSDGSSWVATGLKASDGANWDSLTPQYSDGDSWEIPS